METQDEGFVEKGKHVGFSGEESSSNIVSNVSRIIHFHRRAV